MIEVEAGHGAVLSILGPGDADEADYRPLTAKASKEFRQFDFRA